MRSYDNYKESNIEWLGKIPTDWQLTSLKFAFSVVLGKMLQPEKKSETDKKFPYLRAANIQSNGIDYSDIKKMWFTKSEQSRLTLLSGDLLISEGGDVGRPAIWESEQEMYFQNSINRVRPIGENSNRYLYYWIIALKEKGYIDVLCNKSTIAHFTAEKVAAVPVPLPSSIEQQKIAQFLDYETAKIDALIDEQKRLIELLKEKRQAVISHAVTKGLNPDAPMKDSGVEWLGQIPEYWKTTPIKHVTKTFEQGWSPQCFNEPVSNESEPGVLKVGCVKQGRFDYSENKRLPPELKFKSELAVKAGDLLISRANTRELVGSAGVPTVNHDNLMISDKLFRLKLTGQAISRFVCFFLTTKAARKQIELAATGASDSMLNIGQGTIREMPFPCPPVEEQRQIVDYVVRVNWRLLELAGEALKLVNTLKERRSALISAAVTGKIDVRDWQPTAGSDTVDSNASVQTERHYG